MRSLAILTQAMVARGQAEVADWAAVARDLGTVTNQPLMLRSDKDKDLYYAVAKEVAETSRHRDNYPLVSVCAGGRAERRRGGHQPAAGRGGEPADPDAGGRGGRLQRHGGPPRQGAGQGAQARRREDRDGEVPRPPRRPRHRHRAAGPAGVQHWPARDHAYRPRDQTGQI